MLRNQTKTMNIRAKLRVETVTKSEYAETVVLNAVYGGDKNSEDNTFSEATPSAKFEMTVSNKAVHGFFKPGQKFYVDFTECQPA